MPLLRRSSRPTTAAVHPVSAFWEWWAEEGHRTSPHGESRATHELSRLVAAIHPGLTWHFGPGVVAEHRLTVSAGGVAEVRPSAERWFRAAPPADATWEFRPSQEATPDALAHTLEIAGHRLELAATVFSVVPDVEQLRVHVGVHHPAFGELPDDVPAQVSFLLLDQLLGEDDVERWLGHVEALTAAPEPAHSGEKLCQVVAAMAASLDDHWAVAEWEDDDGTPGVACFRPGLRWLDHPTFDRYQVVTAPYPGRADGLPADEAALAQLQALGEELDQLLAGRGVVVAHESQRGVRTFHAYTDGEDQNADADLRDWASTRGASVDATPDPAWTRVRHFTG
ncbi:hypothetical protein [Nocardioides taihuensis]|uniref:DUF695 domain-containing protein n=1 Tax=Nocardioides taihuensis TaxID=1835606 RepID=A0ABW0BM49_9ACTN